MSLCQHLECLNGTLLPTVRPWSSHYREDTYLIGRWLKWELNIFRQENILHCFPLVLCAVCRVWNEACHESSDRMQNTPHLVIRSLVPSGVACGALSVVHVCVCVCFLERERDFGNSLMTGGSIQFRLFIYSTKSQKSSFFHSVYRI